MLAVALVALIAVPVLEIYVIIAVGHVIGAWWTVFALVAETVVGGWLVRREGRRAWRTLVAQLTQGQVPSKSAADGAVILMGGLLLLMPGFVTDALGFLCVIPFTRPVFRRALVGFVRRRSVGSALPGSVFGTTTGGPRRSAAPQVMEGHEVIEGRLVDPPEQR